eukprot:scaffold3767_cov114-Isochrysis_galbana.AAC.20
MQGVPTDSGVASLSWLRSGDPSLQLAATKPYARGEPSHNPGGGEVRRVGERSGGFGKTRLARASGREACVRTKEEDSSGAGVEEGAPLPLVILVAKLEVAKNNGHLGAGDDEDEDDEREEAEDVVKALQPDGRHDKVELYEDGAKGQDPADDHREERVEIPGLKRNHAWHHVGLDRRVVEAGAVPEPNTDPHQRKGDEEPDAQHGEHRAERHGARRTLPPDEEVEHKEDAQDNARV